MKFTTTSRPAANSAPRALRRASLAAGISTRNAFTSLCWLAAGVGLLATVTSFCAATPAHAQVSESVLHNFVGTDGQAPESPLLADLSGKPNTPRGLYGATSFGGTYHSGTAYMLTAPKHGQSAWTEATLWNFGKDGDDPGGLLSQSKKISLTTPLFGTTNGGAKGYGTVFSLTGSVATTIWTFKNGSDGGTPIGVMPVADGTGALYVGTQTGGGTAKCGTVIELTPPQPGETAWTETTIWTFTGKADGCKANGLIIDKRGVLTGTAVSGGYTGCAGGCGTVFQLTPPVAGQTAWTEQTIWTFQGFQSDGSAPLGTLTPGKKGEFYGVTAYGGDLGGGAPGNGSIFMLIPPTKNQTQWTERVLLNCGSGSCPASGGVIIDASGKLYGTSPFGGANSAGSVFELAPPAEGQGAWTNTTLFSFSRGNSVNGWAPEGPLTADKSGVLYGTTSIGGVGTARAMAVVWCSAWRARDSCHDAPIPPV